MKAIVKGASGLVGSIVLAASASAQVPILNPANPIIPIDRDPPAVVSTSSYPAGEAPRFAFDGNVGTKYLNFGRANTGVILTPGATTLQSMIFTTGNDAPERDPSSYSLFGTNDPITSADNSNGQAENWTLISQGPVALPLTRGTAGPTISFANAVSYSSYRLAFPTLRGPGENSMQIAEIGLFSSSDGSGTSVTTGLTPAQLNFKAIDLPQLVFQSNSPGAEDVTKVIDTLGTTKYLNFGKENSGFIVTPAAGSPAVSFFQLTTANDAPGRDPASWELYGTNDAITSAPHGVGDGENWTLLGSGSLSLPDTRGTLGPLVTVPNTTAYASYRMVFPTLKSAATVDSMQVAEVQFFAVPEPSSVALAIVGLAAACGLRRRNG